MSSTFRASTCANRPWLPREAAFSTASLLLGSRNSMKPSSEMLFLNDIALIDSAAGSKREKCRKGERASYETADRHSAGPIADDKPTCEDQSSLRIKTTVIVCRFHWEMGWMTSKRFPHGSAKKATRRPIAGTSCGWLAIATLRRFNSSMTASTLSTIKPGWCQPDML
jgi:hypothetical protein